MLFPRVCASAPTFTEQHRNRQLWVCPLDGAASSVLSIHSLTARAQSISSTIMKYLKPSLVSRSQESPRRRHNAPQFPTFSGNKKGTRYQRRRIQNFYWRGTSRGVSFKRVPSDLWRSDSNDLKLPKSCGGGEGCMCLRVQESIIESRGSSKVRIHKISTKVD